MRLTTILYFLFFSVLLTAQELSENAEISVLTVGSGFSLNDAFGHSAFRVKDTTKGLDIVYGYGEYDFDAPNFYLKFIQGKLDYLISKTEFSTFYRAYQYYNRSILEQVLNLNTQQQQELFNVLKTNYKPENRRYLYDFFYNNCATKIKDVVNTVTYNTIQFNTPLHYQEKTFRTLIQNNLNRNSWGSFGIDLALGAVIDQKATPEEHMFLPENIYIFFKEAKFSETKKPLVKKNKVLFSAKNQNLNSSFFTTPIFVLSLLSLFIILITFNDFKTQTRTVVLDIFIFTSTGLAGVILLFLWFGTNHGATHNNYNLLWANPLNLILLQQLSAKKFRPWVKKYFNFLLILLSLLVFHWITGVQVFAIGLIPLLIAISFRFIFLIKTS